MGRGAPRSRFARTAEGHSLTDGTDGKAPSVWIRAVGIIGAVYLVVYGAIGLWRDDLLVSLSKSSGNGVPEMVAIDKPVQPLHDDVKEGV